MNVKDIIHVTVDLIPVEIQSENAHSVWLSNGDEVYEGVGIYKGRWLIDSKKRRDKCDEYYKNGGTGNYCNSWFLKATNKQDALKEYCFKTGNIINVS
jgi:hypothetical protein